MTMSVINSGCPQDDLIPSKEVRQTLGGVSEVTIWRWVKDPEYSRLNFPKPIIIGKRRFWKRGDISKFISKHSGAAHE